MRWTVGRFRPVEKKHWRLLCARITQLIGRRETLLPLPWPDEVEAEAQRIADRLVSRSPPVAGAGAGSSMETVDVASLEMVRPRSAGVEHVGLWAMEQLGIGDLLVDLGFNRRSRAVAMGSIIGRMAVPGSERATWRWLCERSALGELLDVDFETMDMMRLYRAWSNSRVCTSRLISPCATVMQTRPGCWGSRSISSVKSALSFVTSMYPSATARRTRAQSCRALKPSQVTCVDSGYPRSRATTAKLGLRHSSIRNFTATRTACRRRPRRRRPEPGHARRAQRGDGPAGDRRARSRPPRRLVPT